MSGRMIFMFILLLLLNQGFCLDLNGSTLAFAGEGFPPQFVHDPSGNGEISGVMIDIADILAEKHNFHYTFKWTSLGSDFRQGKWTGAFGEVMSGNADVALGANPITHHGAMVVDFTVPLIYPEILLFSRQPQPLPQILNVTKPFSLFGWLLLFVTIIFAMVMHSLLVKYTPTEGGPSPSNWMYTLYLLLLQGTALRLKPHSTFIFTLAWLLFTTFMSKAYDCNLRSYLMQVEHEQPIDTMKDILQFEWNFYMPEATPMRHFLANSQIQEYRQVYENSWRRGNFISEANGHLTSIGMMTPKAMRLFDEDKMVIPMSKSVLPTFLNYLQRFDGQKRFHLGKSLSIFSYSGLGLSKNSPLKKAFDKTLTSLMEGGIIAKLTANYNAEIKVTTKSDNNDDVPINMDHILLSITLLFVGLLGSFLQFMREAKRGEGWRKFMRKTLRAFGAKAQKIWIHFKALCNIGEEE